MANRFQEILSQGEMEGIIPNLTDNSRMWFRNRASEVAKGSITIGSVIESMDKQQYHPSMGKLVMFKYDPKTADKLPYFDTFPLVLPFQMAKDGFLGLNFHYLPLDLRARLMDGLYEYASSTDLNDKTIIRATYDLMSSSQALRYFRPCVKHYLNTSLRSRLLVIPPSQWDIALFLPLERFKKTTKENVYRDSRRIIRGY